METVLLYQIKGTKTAALLKPVLLKLGIRVRIVEPEQYLQSIGFLAGNKAFAESPEAYDGAGFDRTNDGHGRLFRAETRSFSHRNAPEKSAADRPQSHRHNAEPGVEFAAALQRIKRRTRKNEIVPEITGLVKKSGIGTFSSCHHSL